MASATLETLYGTALDNKILVGKEELDMIGRQKGTVVDFKSLKNNDIDHHNQRDDDDDDNDIDHNQCDAIEKMIITISITTNVMMMMITISITTNVMR